MEINNKILKETANNYSKSITSINLNTKLEPINKIIEDLLARLEEFQIVFNFMEPSLKNSIDNIASILDYKKDFDKLCEKIDNIEFLMAHMKNNMDMLEEKIEEKETQLGLLDNTSKVTEKVANIFTPLFFKKVIEKKPTTTTAGCSKNSELFRTEDYFK